MEQISEFFQEVWSELSDSFLALITLIAIMVLVPLIANIVTFGWGYGTGFTIVLFMAIWAGYGNHFSWSIIVQMMFSALYAPLTSILFAITSSAKVHAVVTAVHDLGWWKSAMCLFFLSVLVTLTTDFIKTFVGSIVHPRQHE